MTRQAYQLRMEAKGKATKAKLESALMKLMNANTKFGVFLLID